jgi:CheY-like chemotaxis protein
VAGWALTTLWEQVVPKVLVADDNRNIQKVVTLALKDQGIEVIAVGHGEAAVKQLAQVMPDLILADVFMPVRNGYEVCEYVKNNEQFAHIPVVLLFGAYDPIDQKDVMRVRADGTLKKPFEQLSELTSVVQAMLKKAEAARPAGKPQAAEAQDKTLELSAEEVQRLTAEKAAEAPTLEPEPEPFSVSAPKIEFSGQEAPVAFGDLLGESAAPKAEEPAVEEAPQPAVGGQPSQWAAWSAETSAAEMAAAAPAVEADQPVPTTGGIEVPLKEPSPEEPPIAVEFTGREEIEIVRDEAPIPSVAEAGPLPDLATSATEFMEAAPAAVEEAPAAQPEPQRVVEVSERPIEPLEVPAFEELAAPPAAPARVEPAPAAVAEPEPEAPRAEAPPPGPAPPAAEAPAAAAAAPEPSFAGDTDALARPRTDAALVEEIVQRVMARLDAGILDKIAREVVRPIVEAIVASEVAGKK